MLPAYWLARARLKSGSRLPHARPLSWFARHSQCQFRIGKPEVPGEIASASHRGVSPKSVRSNGWNWLIVAIMVPPSGSHGQSYDLRKGRGGAAGPRPFSGKVRRVSCTGHRSAKPWLGFRGDACSRCMTGRRAHDKVRTCSMAWRRRRIPASLSALLQAA